MGTRTLIQWMLIIIIALSTVDFIFMHQFQDNPDSSAKALNIITSIDDQRMRPWNIFDMDIFDILNGLESDKQDIMPQNTNQYLIEQEDEVKIIHNINNIDDKYKTCRSMTSFEYELPIGIPSFNKSIWFNDSFISHIPNWNICLIHSMNTYLAEMTVFNKYHYYSFYMQHTEGKNIKRCYKNKVSRSIVDSLYNLNNKRHLNVVFYIMGNACNSFQHFLINIPIRWSMIYEWYLYLIEITKNSDYYLNVTIATNINWQKKNSIHVWFWNRFGLKEGINRIHNNMNVSIINTEGWCAKTDYRWYAPFVITPYYIDINANWSDFSNVKQVYHRRQMYGWNTLYHMKPLLTNIGTKQDYIIYFNRGNKRKRGVSNNNDIIKYLQKSAKDHGYEFLIFECCNNRKSPQAHFDEDKEMLSKAKIVIGPHGGKFANLVFVQPGSYVIEFNNWFGDMEISDERDRPIFYTLAVANALHYYYISPQGFNYNQQMTIEIEQLHEIFTKIYTRIDNE